MLGAAFTKELISIGTHTDFGAVMTLLKMAVVLKRTPKNYKAKKIFNIAVKWAEEEHLIDSAQYPYLESCIEDVRDFLEDDKT